MLGSSVEPQCRVMRGGGSDVLMQQHRLEHQQKVQIEQGLLRIQANALLRNAGRNRAPRIIPQNASTD